MTRALTATLKQLRNALRFQRDWYMIVLGALVGVLAGLGAVGFAYLLHAAEDASREFQMASVLWILPLLPMAGALATGLLVHFFARDAKGHGVPQVMEALIRRRGVIPLRVGFVKVIASVFTVGTGGSGGAEGPIVQIGSTAGSTLGRWLRVSREHVSTLVGCGAAAGIASIFNAPIAGVFFVLEVLLRDFSARTFTPVVVAAVFSAATTQAMLGRNEAIFPVSEALTGYMFTLAELPGFLVLGILCGFIAVGFSRMLHIGEDAFARIRIHPALRPVVGALLLGLLGIAFLIFARAQGATGVHASVPAFFGNGYETIKLLLEPASYLSPDAETPPTGLPTPLVLLLVLLVCKAAATVFTLGSGGSGGVFAPCLFLGATAGGAFAVVLDRLGLMPIDGSPASYALVGMAAVVAAAMHAPLTAILMLFELTRDVYVLLPVMLAAVVATAVARLTWNDSIYTERLRRSGIPLGTGRDLSVLRRIPVSSVDRVDLPPEPVYPSDPLSKLISLHAYHSTPDFIVVDQLGGYVGMVTGEDMRAALIDREAIPLLLVAELLRTDLPVIAAGETLDTVMEKFARHDVASLPLMDHWEPDKAVALITRTEVMRRYHQALEES